LFNDTRIEVEVNLEIAKSMGEMGMREQAALLGFSEKDG
jgi:hypothetical protein